MTMTGAPVELTPENTPGPAAPRPAAVLSDDIRIVITRNKGDVMIGLQRADCDPQFYQVKDLEAAVKGIPAFLGMADKVWLVNPKNPKAPEPPPAPKQVVVPANKAVSTAGKPAAKPATEAPKVQPPMF